MYPVMDDATSALLRAIRTKFNCRQTVNFVNIASRTWASATFEGARHELTFVVDGEEAEAHAAAFVETLAAEEFALRGHVLADIALVSQETEPGRARIAIEALTVEDR